MSRLARGRQRSAVVDDWWAALPAAAQPPARWRGQLEQAGAVHRHAGRPCRSGGSGGKRRRAAASAAASAPSGGVGRDARLTASCWGAADANAMPEGETEEDRADAEARLSGHGSADGLLAQPGRHALSHNESAGTNGIGGTRGRPDPCRSGAVGGEAGAVSGHVLQAPSAPPGTCGCALWTIELVAVQRGASRAWRHSSGALTQLPAGLEWC